jgi:HEAT repeat protein
MSAREKVIIALRDRLELEQQLKALLEVRSEKEFSRRARRIAEGGDQVVPVVLRNLDHTDSRRLNALGMVASMYPHRGEILNKLYEAAADLDRPDRERVSAMLILERFLGEEPDPYLLQTLDDPRSVAIESIRDLIRASEQDPSVLIEYVRALAGQPPQAVTGIIDTLVEIGQEKAVDALCLMAQHDDDGMAEAAFSALGRLRHAKAVRGLQSLMPVLSPDRRSLGERSLRKLRFAGVPTKPLPKVSASWRALIGPVDGAGSRVVWFSHDPDENGRCHFVGLSLSEREGITQAYGNYAVPARAIPERSRPGHIHRVPFQPTAGENGPSAVTTLFMLEAGLDHGRWLVREAQARNFEAGRTFPPAYRLLSPLIWQYDAASIDSIRQLPPTPVNALDLLPQTSSLPYHPFFRGWYVRGERVEELAKGMMYQEPTADREVLHACAVKLAEQHFDEAYVRQVQARLVAMSEWLWQAEQMPLVELTTVAAKTIVEIPPGQHPFTVSMAELGLNLMVYQLQ